jgi:hypothetical protein
VVVVVAVVVVVGPRVEVEEVVEGLKRVKIMNTVVGRMSNLMHIVNMMIDMVEGLKEIIQGILESSTLLLLLMVVVVVVVVVEEGEGMKGMMTMLIKDEVEGEVVGEGEEEAEDEEEMLMAVGGVTAVLN